MILDASLAALVALIFAACLWSWRQKRELLEILKTRLRTESGGDALIGAVTALDVIHQINRNAPALLDHLGDLSHLADSHAALAVDQIIPPEALSAAVAAGDLTLGHMISAATQGHIYSLDLASIGAHNHLGGFAMPHVSHGMDLAGLDLHHLSLSDAAAHVPITALIVKGWQNWEKVEAGHLSGLEWTAHTAGGVASSTAGALVGKSAGWGVAAAMAPLMGPAALVFVPLGVFTGAMTGGGLFRGIKKLVYGGPLRRAEARLNEARAECVEACARLRKTYLIRYGAVTHAARKQHRRHVAETRRRLRDQGGFLQRMLRPTLLGVGLEESIRRSKQDFRRKTLPYYRKLFREIWKLTAESGGRLLFNQGKERFLGVRALDDAYDRVHDAVNSVRIWQDTYHSELRTLNQKL